MRNEHGPGCLVGQMGLSWEALQVGLSWEALQDEAEQSIAPLHACTMVNRACRPPRTAATAAVHQAIET